MRIFEHKSIIAHRGTRCLPSSQSPLPSPHFRGGNRGGGVRAPDGRNGGDGRPAEARDGRPNGESITVGWSRGGGRDGLPWIRGGARRREPARCGTPPNAAGGSGIFAGVSGVRSMLSTGVKRCEPPCAAG